MEIQNNYSGQTAQSRTAGATQKSDYQTFLEMLTVQMRYQDPLNPQSASDFAVQLATFSGVEQQTQTNQLLTAMLNRSGLADLGGWVGMEARVYGGAWYDGNDINLAPDPPFGAERAFMIVRDSYGNEVLRREFSVTDQSLTWDGRGANDNVVPAGRYTFEIESFSGGTPLETVYMASYQPIIEARNDGAGVLLVLPGGLMLDSNDVSGIRRPPATPLDA